MKRGPRPSRRLPSRIYAGGWTPIHVLTDEGFCVLRARRPTGGGWTADEPDPATSLVEAVEDCRRRMPGLHDLRLLHLASAMAALERANRYSPTAFIIE